MNPGIRGTFEIAWLGTAMWKGKEKSGVVDD